jgi:predicted nucleic acid-binding Zn ribbon protein
MSWTPSGSRGDEPRPVAESLDRLAKSLHTPTPRVLTSVFAHWDDVVGDMIARHVRPVSLDGDTLVVAVDEAAWATQLRFLEADLLAKLAERAGDAVATRIVVRVRPVPGARPRRGAAR